MLKHNIISVLLETKPVNKKSSEGVTNDFVSQNK